MIARRALLQSLAVTVAAPAFAADSFDSLWDERIILRENTAVPSSTPPAVAAIGSRESSRTPGRHRHHVRHRRWRRSHG
jgi:hypothetical protein